MPETTTTNTRNTNRKTKKGKMKRVNRMKTRLSQTNSKLKKAKSENSFINFFKTTYNRFRTQPQVDQTVTWVKENPKKSIGIGVGLLLLTRSRRATNFAKLGLSSGIAGWLFNKTQSQESGTNAPLESTSTKPNPSSDTAIPSQHLH